MTYLDWMSFCKGEIFYTYSVTTAWIGLISYMLVDKRWNIVQNCIFEVNLRTGDTNEVIRFIVSADFEMFFPLFPGEMVVITLNSSHMLQVHRNKSLCATFVSRLSS